jgi:hypothetical protein
MNIRKIVFEAIENAVTNGYKNFILNSSPEEIAVDLETYDSYIG